MPATTELLIEQIRTAEEHLRAAEAAGEDASTMRDQLDRLRKRLSEALSALNEGRQILKG